MTKIKFTKGELKRQRDSLAQFEHYLPTLQLKKQQLQIKVFEVRTKIDQAQQALVQGEQQIRRWFGLLADPGVDIQTWVVPQKIRKGWFNVAGAQLPMLEEVVFADIDFDVEQLPFWVDRGIAQLREFMQILVEIRILEQQVEILAQELRITTQRVNLFEKVKIPECLENIRRIRICLGDQMANAVGISKVAKRKIALAQLTGSLA